jgi:hypothetical protein
MSHCTRKGLKQACILLKLHLFSTASSRLSSSVVSKTQLCYFLYSLLVFIITLSSLAAAIEPTVVQLPGQTNQSHVGPYTYAPNSTDCPADDWTCYVYPLTSCNSSHLGENRQWREPYALTWLSKTLEHAKLTDPYLMKVWNEVVNDLGGGSIRHGQRGLTMIARTWASRPLPRMKREAHSILKQQGLRLAAGYCRRMSRNSLATVR